MLRRLHPLSAHMLMLVFFAAVSAHAQYPNKPVGMIVTAAAGSGPDLTPLAGCERPRVGGARAD